MSALIILIVVAGIVAAVVLNKKKQQPETATPIVAQDPNVSVVENDLVLTVDELIATEEQKVTRKTNATKQASTKTVTKKPVKKSK